MENYDTFKNANIENKIKFLIESAVPLVVLLERKIIKIMPVFTKKIFGSIFRQGFIIFSLMEVGRNLLEIIHSDVLTTKEKLIEAGKKDLSIATEFLSSIGGKYAGMRIWSLFNIVVGLGALLLGD